VVLMLLPPQMALSSFHVIRQLLQLEAPVLEKLWQSFGWPIILPNTSVNLLVPHGQKVTQNPIFPAPHARTGESFPHPEVSPGGYACVQGHLTEVQVVL